GRAGVAGEPDLVHAVVRGQDPTGRDHVADLLDGPQWDERLLLGSRMDVDEDLIAHRQERLGGAYGTAEHLGELVQGRRQVPDDLELREIHLLDDGGTVPDVDDGRPGLIHRERRLLGRIVTDGDDDVGRIDRVVDIV